MPYSRKGLVLSNLEELAKNANRPHPSSHGSTSGPQETLEVPPTTLAQAPALGRSHDNEEYTGRSELSEGFSGDHEQSSSLTRTGGERPKQHSSFREILRRAEDARRRVAVAALMGDPKPSGTGATPVETSDLVVDPITGSFLREGSAADLWLYRVRKTSALFTSIDPPDLPNVVSVVRKVMRVECDYFHNFEGCRDEDFLINLREDFHDRFQLWGSLSHPNIATLYFVASKELTLFQEYCESGDLREYIKRDLSEIDYLRIIADVLGGIAYLHNRNPPIAHGCINPGKIYMRDKTAKLGEFGLSQMVSEFPHLVPSISVTGMTRWMGSEYFNGSQPGEFTVQGDIWSFGCTLFEIFTGTLPYHQSKYDAQVLAKNMDGVLPGNLESVSCEALSPKSMQLVQRCITECWSPFGKRPSSEDLLEQVAPIFTQLSQVLGEVRKPVIGPPPISDTMPVDEMFSHLIRHCSTDMTPQLDFSSVGENQVAAGGYGDIFSGRLRNGTEVALKIPTRFGSENPESRRQGILRAANELYVWSRCDHPNILPLIGATIYGGSITLVSPWMKQGNLHAWRQRNPPATPDCLGICVRIAEGLSYLHSTGIIHGGIKGMNILMSEDMIPKICDFGEAAFLNLDDALSFDYELHRGFTTRWVAPEIVMGDEQSRPTINSDVYALGMTILEIITGYHPWAEFTRDLAIFRALAEGRHPKRPQLHFPLEDEWANLTWDLLTRCWDQDPSNRPTAAEVRDRLKYIIATTGSS
ncbi:hypothetical protein FRC11_001038 [Ceratobasidium sp. 423]|nr:hypothetical protein FRC11_001038 [Ceratobasidium sp. 423]